MKTYSAKPTEVEREWHLIDASEAPLGRISTVAATLLTGKGKPMWTKHIDCGDFVVIINADKLVVTGNKRTAKLYQRHSSYPGGLHTITLEQQLEKDSTKVIEKAVRGMIPVNKLRTDRLNRLKIYKTDVHKHEAQNPQKLNLAKGN